MYLGGPTVILCVSKDPGTIFPDKVLKFSRLKPEHDPIAEPQFRMDVPTDDWPFLYLVRKAVPVDYLVLIGALLVVSIATLLGLRGRSFGPGDLHFCLLGLGFLLLETKGISDCTLYFGATWFVTMIVVSGVLVMVMAGNQVAERAKRFSFPMYFPLFIVLAILLLVPRELILGCPFTLRLVWALFVVPLPVFFAGIIFSCCAGWLPSAGPPK